MTTLATRNGGGNGLGVPGMPDEETLEMVVAQGDLRKLTPSQKVAWYKARCAAADLDPRTQPFQYFDLDGKLTLYATKTATDQLIAKRKLTVRIVSRGYDAQTGLYEVLCQATFPDGQMGEDVGVVTVDGITGKALANAIMKAVTKAKRRTVLSVCGLGMLDETEVEDMGVPYRNVGQVHAEVNEQAQKAIAEADSPVPGHDPRQVDTRPYSIMATEAVEATNQLVSREWGGLPNPPTSLDARRLHGLIAAKAVNLGHAEGPAPTKVQQAVAFVTKVYAVERQWARREVALACQEHVEAVAERLREARAAADDASDGGLSDDDAAELAGIEDEPGMGG